MNESDKQFLKYSWLPQPVDHIWIANEEMFNLFQHVTFIFDYHSQWMFIDLQNKRVKVPAFNKKINKTRQPNVGFKCRVSISKCYLNLPLTEMFPGT